MWETVFECADGIERPNFILDTFIVKGGTEKEKLMTSLYVLETELLITMILTYMMIYKTETEHTEFLSCKQKLLYIVIE